MNWLSKRSACRLVFCLGLSMTIGLLTATAQENPCDCKPNVGKTRPYRLDAKWETKYNSYPAFADTITSSTVRSWESRYKKKIAQNVMWNTKRLKGTPEDTLYVLKGWMWYVKREVDCSATYVAYRSKPTSVRLKIKRLSSCRPFALGSVSPKECLPLVV
jgi:hypothetical protein